MEESESELPTLPIELWIYIFSLAGPKVVAKTVMLVCKEWKQMCDDEYIWTKFARQFAESNKKKAKQKKVQRSEKEIEQQHGKD